MQCSGMLGLLLTVHTHTQPFYGPFPGPPGWAGTRRELLDFMVQGKSNRGRHADHPAGHHSILTKQCPPPPSPHFLQAGCPSCRPTNSVKALEATVFLTVMHCKCIIICSVIQSTPKMHQSAHERLYCLSTLCHASVLFLQCFDAAEATGRACGLWNTCCRNPKDSRLVTQNKLHNIEVAVEARMVKQKTKVVLFLILCCSQTAK